MSRSSRYDLFLREAIREDNDLDEDAGIWIEDYAPPANTGLFDWFASRLPPPSRDDDGRAHWDAFVSYASERRDEFVLPLVAALNDLGVRVWVDKNEYTTGYADVAINEGVARSEVGVLVLSTEYLHKQWTVYEFKALLMCEVTTFVLVALHLDDEATALLERFACRVRSKIDVTVVALRSHRTRGLARRIRAAVRRNHETHRSRMDDDAFDALLDEVDALAKAFGKIIPDPARLASEEQDRLESKERLAELCERSFGGDWDLMRSELPIEDFENEDPDDHWRYPG